MLLVDFILSIFFVVGNCDVTDKKCSACRYKFIGSLLPPPSAFYEKITQEEAQPPSDEPKVLAVGKVEEKTQKENPKVR